MLTGAQIEAVISAATRPIATRPPAQPGQASARCAGQPAGDRTSGQDRGAAGYMLAWARTRSDDLTPPSTVDKGRDTKDFRALGLAHCFRSPQGHRRTTGLRPARAIGHRPCPGPAPSRGPGIHGVRQQDVPRHPAPWPWRAQGRRACRRGLRRRPKAHGRHPDD